MIICIFFQPENAVKEHRKIDLELLDKPLQVSLDNPFDADNSTAMKSKQKLKCKAEPSKKSSHALSPKNITIMALAIFVLLGTFAKVEAKPLKRECRVVRFYLGSDHLLFLIIM